MKKLGNFVKRSQRLNHRLLYEFFSPNIQIFFLSFRQIKPNLPFSLLPSQNRLSRHPVRQHHLPPRAPSWAARCFFPVAETFKPLRWYEQRIAAKREKESSPFSPQQPPARTTCAGGTACPGRFLGTECPTGFNASLGLR